MKPQPARPVQLFYSYAHEDETLRDELEVHLASLKREGVIRGWHDRAIVAGEEWDGEIDEHLKSADIILLLVSPDFLASDYSNDVEVKQALRRHEKDEARVIPVILRPSDWTRTPFSKLQALPKDAKPITLWRNRDEAFLNVAQGIRRAAEGLLAARDPQAETDGAPTAAAPSPPRLSNIPRPPIVGFVARRDEQGRDIVARLKEELAPGSSNLITLSGPGGVGKTTLAAEAVRSLADNFTGRVVWSGALGRAGYSLSTLLDDIVTQLGRPELRTLAPDAKKEQVHTLVSDPPALVVLDNYETVAPDERVGIEEWLTQSRCSSLITSRQRVAPTLNINIAAMSREEAEEFLERLIAQTQGPEMFSASVRQRVYETAEANPFLMEWVVAQIDQAQEPTTVLEELTHGEGDAAERVFDRSFNLPQVGDDGRAALLALSLFSPSASRAALAPVSGFGDDQKRLNEAVKNLRALWLVKGIDENRRFTTEGLTRTLAASRLSKDTCADEFGQRFVAYFLNYAQAHAEPTPKDFDALDAEKDNLLSAVDTAFRLEDGESVVLIAERIGGINLYLDLRGYWDEAIRCNQQAADSARMARVESAVACFVGRIGSIKQRRGLYQEAQQATKEALEIFRELDSKTNVAIALSDLGNLAFLQNNFEEARQLYDESLEIKKKIGHQSGIATTSHQLGIVSFVEGDFQEAERLLAQSREIFERLGDKINIAECLESIGNLKVAQGSFPEAHSLFYEALQMAKELLDKFRIASVKRSLGLLAEKEGDGAEAAQLLRESLSIFEKLGSLDALAVCQDLERLEGKSS